MKKKISMEIEAVSSINTSVYTPDLPKIAVLWLKKYGISNKEISDHKLMWNLKTTSLCFPIYSGNKLVITNERYFGVEMNHPKYLTKGNKTGIMHVIGQPTNLVVLVEDFVSAIKVGRQYASVPLLGSTIPGNWLPSLCGRFSKVRVWLDSNKRLESVLEASRTSQYIPDSKAIFSDRDPKEYSDESIGELISVSVV